MRKYLFLSGFACALLTAAGARFVWAQVITPPPLDITNYVTPAQLNAAIASANSNLQSTIMSVMPTPLAAVPPGPSGAGATGSGLAYVPGTAVQKQTVQRTTVMTNASGVWSVTWATSFVSSQPTINPIPLNATPTNQIVCNPTSRSATSATGQCWTGSTNNNALLSLNISLAPAATAANTPVMVIGAEPTQ